MPISVDASEHTMLYIAYWTNLKPIDNQRELPVIFSVQQTLKYLNLKFSAWLQCTDCSAAEPTISKRGREETFLWICLKPTECFASPVCKLSWT